MSAAPSLGLRVAVALGLMVGFYALAGGIVAVLVGLVGLDLWSGVVHPKLWLIAGFIVYAVTRGCLFVPDGFRAPGPEITAADHPRLFAVIAEVARKMDARMPERVYLMPDVNAFVAEVGGLFGVFGTRRVMGIGVGLLSTDTVGQLEATIAHEFGHFSGGDTRLGGFLYRTRASIARVVDGLGGDSFLSAPFRGYGWVYLRVTHAISRRQELAADAWAVRVAGKGNHIEGLRREHVAGALFGVFLRDEVQGLAGLGFVPDNLFEGFRRFLANLDADGVQARIADELERMATDPTDTHPALADRVAFAAALPDTPASGGDALARTLLDDPDRVERELTAALLAEARRDDGAPAAVVAWDALGEVVQAPRYARRAAEFGAILGDAGDGLDAMWSALERGDVPRLAARIAPPEVLAAVEDRAATERLAVTWACAARVAWVLARDGGFEWLCEPGRPVRLRRGDVYVDPAALVEPAVRDPAGVAAVRQRVDALMSR